MSIKKYKKRILFAIIFVIVFLCFFYIQFPNERLKRRVIFEIEKNSNFQAEIERVSLSPPLKIKIRGLKLTKNEFQTIVIPKAELNPAVLSLLSNYISIPYELNIFRGTAKGNLIISKNTND
ncbi:MAG: type II secretion system protein GspN, partial [Candidatus Dadabacteria bacterium]|nr:type II secretion system protein GspN [Candidatus Dadabacteria bacterium]